MFQNGAVRTLRVNGGGPASNIDVGQPTGLTTGDPVIYKAGLDASNNAANVIGGLTDNTTYYAIVTDFNQFELASSAQLARTGTALLLNPLASTGSAHSFQTTSLTPASPIHIPPAFPGATARSRWRSSMTRWRRSLPAIPT